MTMYEQMMFDFGDPPKVDDMMSPFVNMLYQFEDNAQYSVDDQKIIEKFSNSIDALRKLFLACRDLVEDYSEPGDEEGTHYFLNPDKGWESLVVSMEMLENEAAS